MDPKKKAFLVKRLTKMWDELEAEDIIMSFIEYGKILEKTPSIKKVMHYDRMLKDIKQHRKQLPKASQLTEETDSAILNSISLIARNIACDYLKLSAYAGEWADQAKTNEEK